MSKPWKCRLGWHSYVKHHGQGNPNHQVCRRCGKTSNIDSLMPPGG